MAVIGKLNRVITLQQKSITRDAYGAEEERWADLRTRPRVWANVMQTGASQDYRSGSDREQNTRNARFRIRYRDDVTEAMRVSYDGVYWDIEGIAEWGYRDTLELQCRADVS